MRTLAIAALLCSCANPYAQFYTDTTGGVDVSSIREIPSSGHAPELRQSRGQELDEIEMLEAGYALIGYSSFNGGDINSSSALRHGARVGADVVIVAQQYSNSVSGTMPLTLPTSQTTYSNYSGNIYGSGGSANYYGSGTSTTYGTTTTYIPYTVHRFDYYATYWIKTRPGLLGIRIRELTNDEMRQVGSYGVGVAVYCVVRGTPAHAADIFRDDIIIRVADTEISSADSLGRELAARQGQPVEIELLRGATRLVKTVSLRQSN